MPRRWGVHGRPSIVRWRRGARESSNLHKERPMHPEFWRSCLLALGIALLAGAAQSLFLAWLWSLL